MQQPSYIQNRKRPFNEHNNLHFDNESYIYMSSKNYEESGYFLDLDAITVSYKSHVSYPIRSGLHLMILINARYRSELCNAIASLT